MTALLNVKVDLSEVEAWYGSLLTFRAAEDLITNITAGQLGVLFFDVMDRVKETTTTGALASSIEASSRDDIARQAKGGHVEAAVFSAPPVGGDGGYAIYVEEGTLPHKPPFQAILRWAEIKGPRIGVEDVRRFAGAVWHNIQLFGTSRHAQDLYDTAGYEMFQHAWEQNIEEFQAEWASLPDQVTAKLESLTRRTARRGR